MRTLAMVSWLAALLAGTAAADQARVTVRVIEVPHHELTAWMAEPLVTDAALHDKAVKLALAGVAEIVETALLTVRFGQKGTIASLFEIIWPTESPSACTLFGGPLGIPASLPRLPRITEAFNGAVFQQYEIGNEVEIAPEMQAKGNQLSLAFHIELGDFAGLKTITEFRDAWGDASIRTPLFRVRQLNGSLPMADGVFALAGTFSPKPAAVPAADTRLLVFVCADVLKIPTSP